MEHPRATPRPKRRRRSRKLSPRGERRAAQRAVITAALNREELTTTPSPEPKTELTDDRTEVDSPSVTATPATEEGPTTIPSGGFLSDAQLRVTLTPQFHFPERSPRIELRFSHPDASVLEALQAFYGGGSVKQIKSPVGEKLGVGERGQDHRYV
jgi:hypothetical protein